MLSAAATPAQRAMLASKVNWKEADIRALVKQADLQRSGASATLAKTRLDVGGGAIPSPSLRDATRLLSTKR